MKKYSPTWKDFITSGDIIGCNVQGPGTEATHARLSAEAARKGSPHDDILGKTEWDINQGEAFL